MKSNTVRCVMLVLAVFSGCVVETTPPAVDAGVQPGLDAGAQSDAGVQSDAGQVVDTAAPSLLAVLPSKGATNVRLDSSLVLQFSSAVVPTSLTVTITPNVPLGTPVFNADSTEAQFGPLTLMAGTQYSITVAAADAQGRQVTGERSSSFTTLAQVDTVAPTLVASMPAAGAMDVAVSAGFSLTFSEAMEVSSLALTLEPSKALAEVVWSAGDTVATIASPGLDAKTNYSLSWSATDKAGNPVAGVLAFATAAPPDTGAPSVLSHAPAANAMAVPTNAVLSISFSEAMNKATVDAAFSISPAVAGTALWDGTDTLRSFQPTAPLAPSTLYTVTVAVGARDRAGNPLAAPFTFSFTTAAAADTTRPTVVSTVPDIGAMGVARQSTIAVTFSEPMDKASVQVAFNVSVPASQNGGTFAWSADGRTVTYTPPAPFAYAAAVAYRIGTGSKDLAGNALMSNVDRGFLVRKRGVAVLDSVAAIDGYVTNSNVVSTGSANLIVGDTAANLGVRSFVSFDLTTIPESLITITSADLYLYLSGASGIVQPALGASIVLERVSLGASLNPGAYSAARLDGPVDQVLIGPTTQTPGWKRSIVTPLVGADWAARVSQSKRSQFRMRFPSEVHANNAPDNIVYLSGNTVQTTCTRTSPDATGASCKPHLVVVYEYP